MSETNNTSTETFVKTINLSKKIFKLVGLRRLNLFIFKVWRLNYMKIWKKEQISISCEN